MLSFRSVTVLSSSTIQALHQSGTQPSWCRRKSMLRCCKNVRLRHCCTKSVGNRFDATHPRSLVLSTASSPTTHLRYRGQREESRRCSRQRREDKDDEDYEGREKEQREEGERSNAEHQLRKPCRRSITMTRTTKARTGKFSTVRIEARALSRSFDRTKTRRPSVNTRARDYSPESDATDKDRKESIGVLR